MNQNYVGFGRRFVAAILDGIIVNVVAGVLSFFINGSSQQNTWSYALSLVLAVGYYVFYQASAGQTVGKKVVKIKVVTEQGTKPSAMTFFLREIIGKVVSGVILGIGYLMILWDGRKQALHDKIASTFVVRV